ncbi:aldo-keto reductase family 1 member C18-like isoform X2 [Bufo bufo]|nr:aldo-keto reductase family 1 member C18-like isoform X2 [Bufo bufo]
MEECKESALVKSIGVSSFNQRQLELILNMEGLKHKPVCNQVFDFQLSDEDMDILNQLDRNMRYTTGRLWADHAKCPFHDKYKNDNLAQSCMTRVYVLPIQGQGIGSRKAPRTIFLNEHLLVLLLLVLDF